MRYPNIETEIEIFGEIQPAAYDLDGTLIAVQLKTRDNKTFIIDDTREGLPLLCKTGSLTKINGKYRKDGDLQILRVVNYELLPFSC